MVRFTEQLVGSQYGEGKWLILGYRSSAGHFFKQLWDGELPSVRVAASNLIRPAHGAEVPG